MARGDSKMVHTLAKLLDNGKLTFGRSNYASSHNAAQGCRESAK
jgi:hypothetical protein